MKPLSRIRQNEMVSRPDIGNRHLLLSYIDILSGLVATHARLDPDSFAVALVELRWANDKLASLGAGTIETMKALSGNRDRRLTSRFSTRKAVSIFHNQTNKSSMLLDISQTGVRLTLVDKVCLGSHFHLKLTDDRPILAKIVWSKDEDLGATFVNPIGNLPQLSRFILATAF